ncbi:MAG: efflux RND transporter periplasmic adaptor subunit [Phycisphaeraceae bacterium]
MLRTTILLLSILSVAVMVSGAALGQGGREGDAAPLSDRAGDHDLSGTAEPNRQVQLNAPVSGVLAEVVPEEGEDVTEGDVLARMDDGVQRAAVTAARLRAEQTAELRRARLAVEESEIQLERFEQAYEKEAASDWEVRRSRLQLRQAQAQLEALQEQRVLAEADLAVERARLERLTLTAPFDGRVVRRPAEPGATLSQSDPVIMLVDLDPLEAKLFLPAEMYGKLKVGERVSLRGNVPVNRRLPARVKTIDPIIDPASGTFRCVLVVDNADVSMPAGFTVTLPWPQPEE